ncbi:MAG: hypothetical protein HKN50_05405 [Gammaproteobacteria bacterium]|nr:hypothetical protein [Gammaproteobacteria bacterium]
MKLNYLPVLACLLSLLLAACDEEDMPTTDPAAKSTTQDGNSATAPQSLDERRALREKLAGEQTNKITSIESVAVATEQSAAMVSGEVPDKLLDMIIDSLMSSNGAQRDEVTVQSAADIVFNDGSLGCPKPGQIYTQAQVPGYRVILEYRGQQFDYRATRKGYFILCDQPGLTAPGAGSKPPVL